MFFMLKTKRLKLVVQVVLLLILCILIQDTARSEPIAELSIETQIEQAALQRVGKTLFYDGSYQKLSYPMGDVDDQRGVCTDVVIRSLRKLGVDLQKLVHQDMTRNFKAYPNKWGLTRPDKNIDHRRVPNLRKYFERQGFSLAISDNPDDYNSGDIVSWRLSNNAPHIGIVISTKSIDGKRPLIVHNVGWGTRVDDFLFAYKITGHYRFKPEQTHLSK